MTVFGGWLDLEGEGMMREARSACAWGILAAVGVSLRVR
jgi:hypothetical protein